jgi:predicted metal-dependent hydrolase
VTDAEVEAALRRGVRLFNFGRYLAAQRIWEAAWQATADERRGLLEALVQLAGGLHLRTRRGGTRGAANLVAQALATLEDYRPAAHGIDVDAVVRDFGGYLDWIKSVDRPHRPLDRLRIPRLR